MLAASLLLGAKVTSGMMMNRRKIVERRKREAETGAASPCPPLSRERKRAGCYSVTKEIGFRATRLPAEPCVVALEIDKYFIRNFTVPGRKILERNSRKLVIKVDNILLASRRGCLPDPCGKLDRAIALDLQSCNQGREE